MSNTQIHSHSDIAVRLVNAHLIVGEKGAVLLSLDCRRKAGSSRVSVKRG